MLRKEPSSKPNKVLVTFEFPSAPWVKRVHLVGDFNNWDEQATPMVHRPREKVWQVRLELDRGARYEFRYLVNDSEWLNDWHADEYVPNIHGSDNSVVRT